MCFTQRDRSQIKPALSVESRSLCKGRLLGREES